MNSAESSLVEIRLPARLVLLAKLYIALKPYNTCMLDVNDFREVLPPMLSIVTVRRVEMCL